jgi:ABC-type transporter Mla maintaining outer membrane lipid asymmetry ATPase subunit MlaF
MAGSAESVVQVRDLRMRYGEVDVLDGVDFDVHRGEEVTQVEAAREQAAQWVR